MLKNLTPSSAAIGFFDGVHLGHQRVIRKALEVAEERGLVSAVFTFDPSPKAVLGNPDDVKYITLLEDKVRLIQSLGVERLFIIPFTREFSSLPPETFIEEYIIGMQVKHLVCGFDFTYGRFGKGSVDTLGIHAKNRFTYGTIEKVEKDGQKISSTAIRQMIEAGELDRVPEYLGRRFTTSGTVIPGERRGRKIGYPTANIRVDERYVLPKNGVYIARLRIGGNWHPGVLNIGFKPTFQTDRLNRSIEIHLLDFDRNIYGEKVEIEWHKRIREERKFPSVEALIRQLERDTETARQYFQTFRGLE